MKRAIILLLIAVFGFSTMAPTTATARTVHVSAHPGGKHKKHKKHHKHHKHHGKRKRNRRKK